MSVLSSIGKFFGKVFSFFTSDKAQAIAEALVKYAQAALPIVEFIAHMTPTGIDDEIIALFKRLGLANVEAYLAIPQTGRADALLSAGVAQLQKQFPDAPLSQLRAAVELALQQYKSQ
jgi:Asp/Glu/hydantoin racemase